MRRDKAGFSGISSDGGCRRRILVTRHITVRKTCRRNACLAHYALLGVRWGHRAIERYKLAIQQAHACKPRYGRVSFHYRVNVWCTLAYPSDADLHQKDKPGKSTTSKGQESLLRFRPVFVLTGYVLAVPKGDATASQEVEEFDALLGLLLGQSFNHKRTAPHAPQVSIHGALSHADAHRPGENDGVVAAQPARRKRANGRRRHVCFHQVMLIDTLGAKLTTVQLRVERSSLSAW